MGSRGQLVFTNHRNFSNGSKDGAAAEPSNEVDAKAFEEVAQVLKSLKSQDGKTLDELALIHSLGIDTPSGTVSIKLNLTENYRKVR